MKPARAIVLRVVTRLITMVIGVDYRRMFAWPSKPLGTLVDSRPRRIAPKAALTTVRAERGQALLEAAFVLPIIFLFILVMIDFGIALDRREVLQHSVREGARYGAVGATVAQIQQRAVDQSQGILTTGDVTVCYVDVDGNGVTGNVGDNVRVSANFTYKFNVGSSEMLTAFGVTPPSIKMTPSADMRLEKTISGGTACP